VGGDHYKKMKIQPMEYCLVNNISYIEGNVIKYVSCWRFREGLQDLEKAQHYLEMLIAYEKGKLNESTKPKTWHMREADMGPGTPEDGGHHSRQEDQSV
jgi:hypothetical protein